MSDEKRLLDLVGKIYEAALDPVALNQLPAAVAGYFDSDSCIFFFNHMPVHQQQPIPDNARLPISTANFDVKACTAYATYYHERDEFYLRGWRRGFPAVVIGRELISTEALMRTEFSDFCKLTGGYEVLGAQCMLSRDLIFAIGIHRPLSERQFTDVDKRSMKTVLPHIQRALQIHDRLGAAGARSLLAIDALDALGIGLLMVGPDARLLYASGVADRSLRHGQHLALRDGNVVAPYSRNSVLLCRVIANAIRTSAGLAGGAGGSLMIDGRGPSKLSLLVAPMRVAPAGYGTIQPAAIILFSDPQGKASLDKQLLREIFDLTPAECRLLLALLDGVSLQEYAKSAQVSYGTVRIHLKHLLHKSGCHRQVDLIRTVLNQCSVSPWESFVGQPTNI